MKRILPFLFISLLLLGGCGNAERQITDNTPSRLAEVVELTAEQTNALRPGDSVAITPSPKLVKCFWEAARMHNWFHLPEFSEGNQPTDPEAYWFLVLTDNVVGLDRQGYWLTDDRWPENTSEEYGDLGNSVISRVSFDEFVRTHFGNVQLQHEVGHCAKMYDFDGENYYALTGGSFPIGYFGLQELTAEKRGDRVIYTARLNEYNINELNAFEYNNKISPEANAANYAEWRNDEYIGGEYKAASKVYGKQIAGGELTCDEAFLQMVQDGQTDSFPVIFKVVVSFYIAEETQQPVYLAVSYERVD